MWRIFSFLGLLGNSVFPPLLNYRHKQLVDEQPVQQRELTAYL